MEESKSAPDPNESPYSIQVKKKPTLNFRKHILVIGQTGHGKTTFVNGLFNYLYNTKPENFIYITDFQNNKKNLGNYESLSFGLKSQTLNLSFEEFNQKIESGEGVTQSCIKYNCKDEFIIFDTPGLSDGKGIEEDDKNIETILKDASKAGHLNAIIYIINSTIARRDISIENSINRLASIVPEIFSKSVILVHTFSNDGTTKFQKSWLPFTPKNEFFMDTNCFDKSQEYINKNSKRVTKNWEKCKTVFQAVKAEIETMSSQTVEEYKLLFSQHNLVKSQYSELKVKTKTLLNLKSALENYRLVYENYQKFYEEQQICVTEYINTEYHNTLCMLCNIHICHQDCYLNLILEKGSSLFNDCACMNSEKICKVCAHNHKQHYHDHKIPVSSSKTVKKLIESFKEKDLTETVEIEEVKELEQKINEVNNHMAFIEKEIENTIKELIKTAKLMKGISPKFDILKQIRLEKDFLNKEIQSNPRMSVEKSNELQNWSIFLDRLHYDMIDVYQLKTLKFPIN